MIRKDANVAQVDADAAVPVDGVGQDGVASAGVDRVHADQDAIAGVEGDHVARAGRCAAEGVVRRAVVELHAESPLPSAVPAASVPMKLPSARLPIPVGAPVLFWPAATAGLELKEMPATPLPAMMLASAAAVPPMVLSAPHFETKMPLLALPMAAVPAASVPISLPAITLSEAAGSTSMPRFKFPEKITLPAREAAAPPIELFDAPRVEGITPSGAVGRVPPHQSRRCRSGCRPPRCRSRRAIDFNAFARVARDHVARARFRASR